MTKEDLIKEYEKELAKYEKHLKDCIKDKSYHYAYVFQTLIEHYKGFIKALKRI